MICEKWPIEAGETDNYVSYIFLTGWSNIIKPLIHAINSVCFKIWHHGIYSTSLIHCKHVIATAIFHKNVRIFQRHQYSLKLELHTIYFTFVTNVNTFHVNLSPFKDKLSQATCQVVRTSCWRNRSICCMRHVRQNGPLNLSMFGKIRDILLPIPDSIVIMSHEPMCSLITAKS